MPNWKKVIVSGSDAELNIIQANEFSGSFSGSFQGDGSQLTGISGGGDPFPYTGSALITGSLSIIGPLTVTSKINLNDGGGSVFIGSQSGLNDDASNNINVGVGYQTLRSNTVGSRNTATGNSALLNNTTGSRNTAIGASALSSNTEGFNNTANGSDALNSNIIGSRNTAIGANALNSNISSSNTAIGSSALFFNTLGSRNSAIGNQSLLNNTTGANNVASGYDAGRYIADKLTAATIVDNSVLLGYDTSPLADNETNQIVIGHSTIGNGSNSVTLGNTSITKTVLRGDISGSVFSGSFVGDGSQLTGISGGGGVSNELAIAYAIALG